jgi:hypothetical protein
MPIVAVRQLWGRMWSMMDAIHRPFAVGEHVVLIEPRNRWVVSWHPSGKLPEGEARRTEPALEEILERIVEPASRVVGVWCES